MSFVPCPVCGWRERPTGTTTHSLPPLHHRLADEDIDKIAKRVVILLYEEGVFREMDAAVKRVEKGAQEMSDKNVKSVQDALESSRFSDPSVMSREMYVEALEEIASEIEAMLDAARTESTST